MPKSLADDIFFSLTIYNPLYVQIRYSVHRLVIIFLSLFLLTFSSSSFVSVLFSKSFKNIYLINTMTTRFIKLILKNVKFILFPFSYQFSLTSLSFLLNFRILSKHLFLFNPSYPTPFLIPSLHFSPTLKINASSHQVYPQVCQICIPFKYTNDSLFFQTNKKYFLLPNLFHQYFSYFLTLKFYLMLLVMYTIFLSKFILNASYFPTLCILPYTYAKR